MEHPPAPTPTFEPLEEEILEEYFEGLCQGDYNSIQALEPWERRQLEAFVMAKQCQWLVQLEQRTKA